MKTKFQIEEEINDCIDFLSHLNSTKNELWQYHPLNPNFINPIKSYDRICSAIDDIEEKILLLKKQITSLN